MKTLTVALAALVLTACGSAATPTPWNESAV
jgi:hypothetical protein